MKPDIKTLTLEEKMLLLNGCDLWHNYTFDGKLPGIMLTDGPNGVRMKDENNEYIPATAMPGLATVGNTWNVELSRLQGYTIANEVIEKGADVLLAPGVNIKRTPLCGRNFEYFSEDPYLAGEMGKAFIEGAQSTGVGTSLKHFFANNREYERHQQSSDLDERTAWEIYLPAFEKSLEAKPWTVMCSYNRINGEKVSQSRHVLNGILREKLGYDGLIVSDWRAVWNSAEAVKATLDWRMPYEEPHLGQLKEAYEKGEITEADIDARVEKILELIDKVTSNAEKKKVEADKTQRHKNAEKIAEEGIVLLKNNNGILPLNKGEKVLLAGDWSNNPPIVGGGSAYVLTEFVQTPLSELLANGGVEMIPTAAKINALERVNGVVNSRDLYEKAPAADKVVLCLGNNRLIEAEAFDRVSIRLSPVQEEIILRTASYNPNLVVVLYSGSAIDVSPWIDKVAGVVQAGFSGEGINEALANVLTGKVNPSGKLNETYPLSLEDTPTGSYRGDGFSDPYIEGIFVGYRHYDKKGLAVGFPFGHGLSYTTFEYSDMAVEKTGELQYNVSFTLKNTGAVAGKEVAQLYVRDCLCSVPRPVKELKGFVKTELAPGESKRITLKLDKRSFAFWDVATHGWKVEPGEFRILVGASSRDIRLEKSIEI